MQKSFELDNNTIRLLIESPQHTQQRRNPFFFFFERQIYSQLDLCKLQTAVSSCIESFVAFDVRQEKWYCQMSSYASGMLIKCENIEVFRRTIAETKNRICDLSSSTLTFALIRSLSSILELNRWNSTEIANWNSGFWSVSIPRAALVHASEAIE